MQGVPAVAEATAPDRLAALGYLAPDTSVVAGVHVAELLADDAGKRLLNDPIKVGSTEFRLGGLAGWTGLRPEDVDHVVVGVKADDALPPRLNVVVPHGASPTTRRKSAAPEGAAGRRGSEGAVPLRRAGRRAAGVVVRRRADAGSRPAGDPPGGGPAEAARRPGSLVPELRPLLRERMRPAGPVWAAGHAADWANTAATPLLDRLGKDDRDRVRSVRTFGLWLQPGREVTVNAVLRCADEAAARGLGEYVHRRWKVG